MIDQFRSTALYERLSRHEAAHQFVKYAIVGAFNTGIFFALFNALLFYGIPVEAAYATGFLVASINSFLLNKRWTFRDGSRHAVIRQYFVFVFFTLVGLGVNTGLFSLLLIPLRQYGILGKNLAALAAMPFSVIWNFTSYRLWTFTPGAQALSEPDE